MIYANISLVRATDEEAAIACHLITVMKKAVDPDSLIIDVETAALDRMDFTAGGKCDTCQDPIKAGSVFIFKINTGNELACCPACRYRFADPGLKPANLTRGVLPMYGDSDRDGGLKLEYLRLRYEKLAPAGFTIPPFRRLDEIYRRYMVDGSFSVEHQAALEQILSRLQGKFSLRSLQLCYAYSFFLNVALSRLPPGQTVFLGGVLRMLKNNLFLTRGQTLAARNWLTRLKLPVLPDFPDASGAA